jgi:hypothetical protein
MLIAVGLAIALWLLSSYAVAYRLTRRLHAIHPEPTPSITWGTIEPLRLATSDGEEIGAWYVDSKPNEPVVLLLHGHGGCRGNCLGRAELAASWGCSVMMISLRAHGDSTGDFDDIGYSARHDVVSAVDWIEKRHSDRPVVIWGERWERRRQFSPQRSLAIERGDTFSNVPTKICALPYEIERSLFCLPAWIDWRMPAF